MMRSAKLLLVALCFLSSFAALGCSNRRTYPVIGTTKLKDGSDVSRLAGHGVSFEAVDPGPDGQRPSAAGEIGADGKFLLSTNATNDGAYPGKYRVAVTPPIPPVDAPRPKPVIHSKYNSLSSTDLEVTVEEKSTPITLELEPAGR